MTDDQVEPDAPLEFAGTGGAVSDEADAVRAHEATPADEATETGLGELDSEPDAGETVLTPAEPDAEGETPGGGAAPDGAAADRGSFATRFMNAGGDGLVAGVLGAAAVATAASGRAAAGLDAHDVLTIVLGALALAVSCWAAYASPANTATSVYPTGSHTIPRLLVLAGVAVGFAPADGGADAVAGWAAIGVLLALLVAEPTYRRIVRGAIPYAVHVPGLRIRNTAVIAHRLVFWVNTACVVVVGVLLIVLPAGLLVAVLTILLVAAAVAVSLIGAVDGVLRVRARRHADRRITALLTDYAPSFAVHWDAEAGTGYQLAMWLPFLDRLGERYIVIVRNARSFGEITTLTEKPVLLRQALADMDAMVVPSLTTAFYVNNAVRNAHFARYMQLTHVQLNHGDSDKAPSFNPVFRMFDRDFVAGQAAIDRFEAHGVHTRPGFFEIVGRPQVEAIEVASATRQHAENGISSTDGSGPHAPRVLYAPTWAGFNADSAYSSLPIGPTIVAALLARGCAVIYRPHPYTHRNKRHAQLSARIKQMLERDARSTGRRHVWGRAAETEMSVVDCFNDADAMIADISSVVPDFLYSEKPFALTAMSGDAADLEAELPIATVGYTVEADAGNLDAAIDALLGPDPKRAARHELKTYYLGDFPADHYADAFLDAARRILAHPKA